MTKIRTVLITGGAKRIGLAIAKYLHQYGFNIIITYNKSKNDAEKVLYTLNNNRSNSCAIIQANFSTTKSYNSLYNKALKVFGRIDVLINNASKFYPTKIDMVNDKNWADIINTNLKTPLFLSKSFFPELKKRKGSIINIIDIHVDPPLKNHIIYNLSKAGLLALTQSLAKDLAPTVRVNGVSPGAIMWPKSINKKRKKEIISKIALKRIGEPDDIAKTILFLITNGDYITGQNINVDGGRRLNM
ncbi:MAG: pteridine reductase [Pelagibacterales bacterium]|nr:pteridine reductase [Pelagibacterales bacterium]|tara:strand:- start:2951 stop:3685 length:735 start_codon:yes stop_codon:yes gene_type:complete